jgi:hypothetical protein
MKVNIFLRIVNGRGTIRSMKSAISATSRRKTYAVGSAMCNSTPPYLGEDLSRRCRRILKNCVIDLRDCNRASYWQINHFYMVEVCVVLIRVLIESCQLVDVDQATKVPNTLDESSSFSRPNLNGKSRTTHSNQGFFQVVRKCFARV